MSCVACRTFLPADAAYCPNCGAPVARPMRSLPLPGWPTWRHLLMGGCLVMVPLCGLITFATSRFFADEARATATISRALLWFVDRESAPILSVIDQFMAAGARQDARAAFELFHDEVDGTMMSEAQLADWFVAQPDLFTKYTVASRCSISYASGTDGTTASVFGTLNFWEKEEQLFTADFTKVDGTWKLTNIEIPAEE
jgi:hypothetical protein